jgi:CPA1 family monovalent cation:H+ antiporter
VDGFETVLAAVLVAVAVLNAVASRLGVPYPIVLVVGGLALGLLPGLPDVELEPDLVLLVFLPPLLYSAAFFSDLRSLRRYARALSLIAVGLVLLTTALVALAGHAVLGLPWPVACALGAIVSPTDPVAATAIMRRMGAPRQIVDLVEGESLVNDAAALVAYRVAVAAAVEGTFSPGHASTEFLVSVVGGVAVGLAVGWVVGVARRRLDARRPRSRSPWPRGTWPSCRPSTCTSRGCWRWWPPACTSGGGPRSCRRRRRGCCPSRSGRC